MRRLLFMLKKVIRPLIPDRLMARIRMRQHSRHVRWNVDIFTPDRRVANRWKDCTPDTYRVRLVLPSGDPSPGVTVVTDDDRPTPAGLSDEAMRLLNDPFLGAVIAGETDPPRIVNMRRSEPEVGPRLIAIRDEVLKEVGGIPEGDTPLPVLHDRLRQAGHPVGLIPLPRTGAPTRRADRITLPTVIIFALVPMHDIGGGARSTQLALELLRQGYHVVLATVYESQESLDLGLRFIHPELEQYSIPKFDLQSILDRAAQPGLVLVEAPTPDLVELARTAKNRGWEVIYDIVDDWSDPSLGGEWFEPEIEATLVGVSDRVVASAPDLVARAKRLGADAELIPNAVNAEVFAVDNAPRPPDLPDAEILIGYHGSLYGDWFDWAALREVGEAFPRAALIVIGDNKHSHPPVPANVHFLGLKPQTELPSYLQHLDVGLLSFRVNDTTHAVSPLKVYEYLASGVPVATPPLRSLHGLDGVWADTDLVAAVRQALDAPRPDRAGALHAHSWEERIGRLTRRAAPGAGHPALVVSRPAVHRAPRDRVVR